MEAMAIRTQCCKEALKDVCNWLENGGEVAVISNDFTVSKQNYELDDLISGIRRDKFHNGT